MSDLFDLPYSKVIDIYNEYQIADANNDIATRTLLLREYPEIFQRSVLKEIERVSGQGRRITKKIMKRPIDLASYIKNMKQ